MVKIAEIIYNGKKYTRNNSKWVDSDNMVVHEALQRALNKIHNESIDFSSFTVSQLVEEGDKYKKSFSYDLAIAFYEKAMEDCNEKYARYILPRITSCYRHQKRPRRVIELFALAKYKFGEDFLNAVLLTSVAAAYCDLQEYQNALRCCKWAYKRSDGEANPNLANVYARIKKESGLE